MAHGLPPSGISLGMSTKDFIRFDDSSVESIWRTVRRGCIPELVRGYCPIPFITAANYFDLLNVFIEVYPWIPSHLTEITKIREKRYRYVAKLQDVITFRTNDDILKRSCISVGIHDVVKPRPKYTYTSKGVKDGIKKGYTFTANNVQAYKMYLNLSNNVVAVRRDHRGLEKTRRLLIISEVCSTSHVVIQTHKEPGGQNVLEYEGPLPLSFAAIRVRLDSSGVMESMDEVAVRKLIDENTWLPPKNAHPTDCPVLKALRPTGIFDITSKTATSRPSQLDDENADEDEEDHVYEVVDSDLDLDSDSNIYEAI